jgi:translocation and assembly module TamB
MNERAFPPIRTVGLKRFIMAAGALLGAVVLLTVGFLAYLQSDAGKEWLRARLSVLLSAEPERRVELGRIGGTLPWELRLENLTIKDSEGSWLILDGLRLRWSPLRLLLGEITIHELEVASIQLQRRPQGQREESSSEGGLPRFTFRPPPLTIGRLFLPRISIGEALAGHPAVLELLAFLDSSPSKSDRSVILQVRRLDEGPELRVNLEARFEAASSSLNLELEAHESTGGLLSRTLSLEDKGPLTLHISGNGPSTAWKGDVAASAARWGSLGASFTLAFGEDVQTECFGVLTPAAPGPSPEGKPSHGAETTFHLKARLLGEKLFHLDHAELQGEDWLAAAVGKLDLKSGVVESTLDFKARDLGELAPATIRPLRGRGELCFVLSGSLDSPQAVLNFNVVELSTAGFQAENLAAELRLNPLGPDSAGESRVWAVTGSGRGTGLKGSAGHPLPERDLHWTVEAEMVSGGAVTLKGLNVEGDYHQLDVKGQMDQTSLDGSLHAGLRVKDLRALSGFLGKELPGRLNLSAEVTGNGRTRTASGLLKGEMAPGEAFPNEFRALLGPTTTLTSRVELRDGEVLDLSEVLLASNAFRVAGRGSLHIARKSLEGEIQTSIPDLKPLSTLLQRDVSGQAENLLKISGAFQDFAVSEELKVSGFRWGPQPLTDIHATLTAAHLPQKTSGQLKVLMTQAKEKLEASTIFGLEKQHLRLSPFSLEGPGSRMDGEIALDLQAKSANGSVRGRFDDLGRLGRFLGEPLQGSGSLDARLTTTNGSQNLALQVAGKELGARSGKLARLDLRADLKDLQRNIRGALNAEIAGLQMGETTIRSATLQTTGDRSRLSFTGRAGGRWMQEADLQVTGSLSRSAETLQLEMSDLKGSFGPYPFKLTDRFVVQRSPRALSLDGLSLSLGSATIQASGSLAENRIQGRLRAQSLPLQLAALMGGPDVVGTAVGQLEVQGPASQPTASAEVHLSEFRFRGIEERKLPAAAVHARARLQGGQLRGDLTVEQLLEKPAKAEFTLPVRLSASPDFTWELSRTEMVRAHAELEGELGRLAGFLPLSDQNISGRARAWLDVNGTIVQPVFSGDVQLEGGFYENLSSGTVLKEINVEMTARDRRLEITRFQATDGERGKISLGGWVELDASGHFPMELEATLSGATLIRRPDLDATASGKVKISGSAQSMKLGGSLTIAPAEYRIPARLPAGAAELKVVELHKPVKSPAPDALPKSPSEPLPLGIDLSLDFPNRAFVRGRGLDSEWKGRLNISGNARRPTIEGQLNVVRGYFDFLDRRFHLTRGTITFFGSNPPVPYLDLTAEAKAKEITALAKIRGISSAPEIEIQSDPPLPQEEVLARLLFGRSVDKITPIQALKLAQALRSLSGASRLPGLDFLGATRRLLGLDQLELRTAEGTSETGLGFGKYLTEDLYIDVEKNLGGTGGKVSVEVELTPNISVESEVGSDAHTGVGVNWKYDY